MKDMKKNILMGMAALLGGFQTVAAQGASENFPKILLSTQQASIPYNDTTLTVGVMANNDYRIVSSAEWLSGVKSAKGNKTYVKVQMNTAPQERTAELAFYDPDSVLVRTFTVVQEKENTAETLEGDYLMKVAGAEASSANSASESIAKTYDNNMNTIWHSRWASGPTEFPVTVTYAFRDVEKIDYLVYNPRLNETNGNFQEIEVWYSLKEQNGFTKYGDYDLKGSSAPSTITFTDGLLNPDSIRFVIHSGVNNFASCAEMQFFRKRDADPNHAIFADEVWTKLQPGTTQADVDALTNPFCKLLAQRLLDGTYDTKYRVADYACYLHPSVLSDRWNAPGKLYDQMEGVTGINITKGKTAVMVSGIPDGVNVQLKVMAWFAKELNNEGVGGGPAMTTYALHNGMNVIEYTSDFDGLAYIAYYVQENPESYPDIRVHFVNAQVNGYLSPEKTNEEMYELCANAVNACMDVVGTKVHSVWTSKGLRDYCKASDNTSLGYRQYMNVLDSLIAWEHELLGFEKYKSVPKNHTMAYVNYTYYMFQGGYGVSFMYNTESRVLNCRQLMYRDDDAIWGLSHEWGHQHQMHPYFCWAGMSEVTNNLNSYYNIMHMGYYRSDKINNWNPARNHFIKYQYAFTPTNGDDDPYNQRRKAVENAAHYSFSPKLKALSEEMAQYTSSIPSAEKNPAHAVGITEVGVGEVLCPFIMLYNWATLTKGMKDFGPDMFEALRQTDNENGSQIEKQGEVDKYELIASAQNNNKNGKLAVLREKYPESCWVTDNYITEQYCDRWDNSAPYIFNYVRKVSRLTGYNLFPYFDRWGFLRQVALRVGDYGEKSILITPEMYQEFKADMDALVESGELKVMPDGMVEEISNTRDINLQDDIIFPTPDIPN